MSFRQEGDFPVEIIEAVTAEPKFAKPPAFDICIHVKTEDGQDGWWRGEISTTHGKGNFADRTQAQITLETLQKIGLQGTDLTNIGTLVGMKTVAHVEGTTKETDYGSKTYYNIKYLGVGGDIPVRIDGNAMAQRLSQLFGTPAPAPAATVQQPATNPFGAPGTAAPNPFTGK